MSIIAKVTVPATTANIGPGFDCLGAALSLYNHFEFRTVGAGQSLQITVEGDESARVTTDDTNLAYRTFVAFYQKIERPLPAIHLHLKLGVPLSRGLGSSSTAIVGGLLGANLLAGCPLETDALAALATDIEGHPDNVVPALLGGCQLAANQPGQPWTVCEVPWHASLVPVVAIPDFELSTVKARTVLPDHYSRADAVFNTAHLGLLLRGVTEGNGEWVKAALCDRIHQPYRKALIPGYESLHQAALDAGAWGLVISGAGPTLLALASPDTTESVQQALTRAWQGYGFSVRVMSLRLDPQGAVGQISNI